MNTSFFYQQEEFSTSFLTFLALQFAAEKPRNEQLTESEQKTSIEKERKESPITEKENHEFKEQTRKENFFSKKSIAVYHILVTAFVIFFIGLIWYIIKMIIKRSFRKEMKKAMKKVEQRRK